MNKKKSKRKMKKNSRSFTPQKYIIDKIVKKIGLRKITRKQKKQKAGLAFFPKQLFRDISKVLIK